MPVKKIGKKFFPLKKNGKPWKTGFPTKAKAEAAIKSNIARLKKITGKKPKAKKPKKAKKAKKKKKKKKAGGKVAKGNPNNNNNKNKFPPGKLLDGYLLSAAAIDGAVIVAQNPGAMDLAKSRGAVVLASYTGVNMLDGTFKSRRLGTGYGPVVVSKGLRKVMKAGGVPSLPTTKPKSVGDFLDNLSFHGPTALEIADLTVLGGEIDPRTAHLIATRNYGGVDITNPDDPKLAIGNAVLKSYLPYYLQKTIRRGLRQIFGISFSMKG